ncbi:MAG: hypothetical protein ACI9F2_000218 [Lysobacterales bacterium]|jgi:hypothetical protein
MSTSKLEANIILFIIIGIPIILTIFSYFDLIRNNKKTHSTTRELKKSENTIVQQSLHGELE